MSNGIGKTKQNYTDEEVNRLCQKLYEEYGLIEKPVSADEDKTIFEQNQKNQLKEESINTDSFQKSTQENELEEKTISIDVESRYQKLLQECGLPENPANDDRIIKIDLSGLNNQFYDDEIQTPKPSKTGKSTGVKKSKTTKKSPPGKSAGVDKSKVIQPSTQNVSSSAYFDTVTVKKLDSNLGTGFAEKLAGVALKNHCRPQDLLAVLCVESTLKPNAKNGNHYGLMQISGDRLKKYGISGKELLAMDPIQQLDYVDMYLQEVNPNGDYLDGATLYAKVLVPALANNKILCYEGSIYYNKNRKLDFDKDGKISKADLEKFIARKGQSTLSSLPIK